MRMRWAATPTSSGCAPHRRVRWLGRLSDADAASVIAQADVGLVPFLTDPFNDAGCQTASSSTPGSVDAPSRPRWRACAPGRRRSTSSTACPSSRPPWPRRGAGARLPARAPRLGAHPDRGADERPAPRATRAGREPLAAAGRRQDRPSCRIGMKPGGMALVLRGTPAAQPMRSRAAGSPTITRAMPVDRDRSHPARGHATPPCPRADQRAQQQLGHEPIGGQRDWAAALGEPALHLLRPHHLRRLTLPPRLAQHTAASAANESAFSTR